MFVCAECGASQAGEGTCAGDGTPLRPVGDDLLLGQQIGVYRVARLLGIGGMGRVYKAVHPQIGSRVAIKVLSRECTDRRELVERFFAEAKAVNLIRHESIVNVLDLATLPDGRPYIIMEYLDGAPLAAILEDARRRGAMLPIGGVARLAAEVLDALGAAHAKGIVHRDLKPDNIFITPQGRPTVLDFGIAKLRPELGGSSTHTGSLLGTPHYMSPEQAMGRPVDPRADIYAMGVILFECLTLRRPFVAESLFDLLKMHVEVPPPPPRTLRPDLPVDLEHVILTALGKMPEQRFGSAAAMSTALQHATAQLPAESWAAITPTARTPAQAAWQPTPPASWANSRRADAQAATVTGSSGQIATQAPARRKSGKGLWLVLAGIVLVGGGVTIGVVLSRSDEAPRVAKQEEPPAPVPTPAPAPPPGPTPSPQPAPEPAPAKPDDDDMGVGMLGMTNEQAMQMADGIFKTLPPDQLAKLPKDLREAYKKYGSFTKMPENERAKIAGELLGVLPQLMQGGGLGGMDAINNALAGGTDDAPRRIDIAAMIARATKEVLAKYPDAKLVRISAQNVFADGHGEGDLYVRFTSDALTRASKQCTIQYIVSDGDAQLVTSAGMCEQPVPVPHCSVKAALHRALAQHGGFKGPFSVEYYFNPVSKQIVWNVTTTPDDDLKPVAMIPDGC